LRQFVYIVALALVLVAAIIAAAWVYRACCNVPPIQIEMLDAPSRQYCPGDTINSRVRVTITATTLRYMYRSVMDEGENYSFFGTEESVPPSNQPRPTIYVFSWPWTVPDLPPGTYHLVTGGRGHETDELPVSDSVDFIIKTGCPPLEGQEKQ
jgi:hypothetical protein